MRVKRVSTLIFSDIVDNHYFEYDLEYVVGRTEYNRDSQVQNRKDNKNYSKLSTHAALETMNKR